MTSTNEANKADDGGKTSTRSTVEFPYTDLENAIEVVRGVHAAGGTACDYDQLAAQLGMEAKGGGFRMRVIGAQVFRLITYERGGRISLTDLGMRINDPQQEKASRVDSFLSVELYQKVFDQFRGSPLPPQAGFERALVTLGVGPNVKDKARQVLQRSAKQAGFFEMGADRLTKPSIKAGPTNGGDKKDENVKESQTAKAGGGNGGGHHPFIEGLLQTLPPIGSDWTTAERANWLSIASGVFKLLYKGSAEEIEIKIKQ
ncbi:MAG: hypothetical protein D4S02_17965 [Rhodocyclaceae bacterium]|nr:MAG: hypothetical protein D4S02_17965 [Rhodocyclaceae bacterium]